MSDFRCDIGVTYGIVDRAVRLGATSCIIDSGAEVKLAVSLMVLNV